MKSFLLKKLFLQSITNEETRKKVITIIIGIFIVIFVLFTATFYILSSPFKAIENYFMEDELEYVKSIRNEYGYQQLIDIENEDYIDSGNYNFSDVIFSNGETDVVYYNQADSRWKDMSYGKTGTIGRSGCGPTSLAMVISTLTDNNVSPVEVSKWSYRNGYYCEGSGSYHSLIPAGGKHFGLNVKGKVQPQELIDSLSNGKLVIVIMGKGHFTKGGHFIVLRGVTEEGKILVADPISINRSKQEWDLSIILNEARRGADAGGPFWIIGR